MKLIEAISQKVKNLLDENNLTQYEFCKRGGISRSLIWNIINLNKKKVTVDTIYEICATLEITLEEFFSDPLFNNLDD